MLAAWIAAWRRAHAQPPALDRAQVAAREAADESFVGKFVTFYMLSSAVSASMLLWWMRDLATDPRYAPLALFTGIVVFVYLALFLASLRGHHVLANVLFFFVGTALILAYSLVFSAAAQAHLLLLGMFFAALVFLPPDRIAMRYVMPTVAVSVYLIVEFGLPYGAGFAPLDGEALVGVAVVVRVCVVAHVSIAVAAMQYRFRSSRRILQGVARHGEKRANTDQLTGLHNRRPMVRRLEELAAQGAGGYAIAVIDVDEFKAINDGLGHDCGDRLIKEVADILSSRFRESDMVSRWGGDEFLVIMSDLSGQDVLAVLERVRTTVNGSPRVCGDRSVRVTVSVGAALGAPGETPDEVITEADRALYLAKAAGRDRVVVLGEGIELVSRAAQGER
ncbi:diguanylate cyclase [Demequina sp. NBRC 110054]|uniref:GGDEF domain-containing protein n=1 Tax=Demequina sp. NBRC 110054 TaxID=1570343 RepID=UPI001177D0AA|nr:GGDEF domain-containing protein [Demequina sp. NBRC 110054]